MYENTKNYLRYREKGYTNTSLLIERIFQPSDSWEKSIKEAKINEAFYDESVYKVTANTEEVQTDVNEEKKEEKLTEL